MSTILDVRGLECPQPVLRLKRLIQSLNCGETIEVLATDKLSQLDIPFYLHKSGHKLLSNWVEDGVYMFKIEVAAASAHE